MHLCILQVSNEMLSIVTSDTTFSDGTSNRNDLDWDVAALRSHLQNLQPNVKAKFKAREMFSLLSDMWFYSESRTTGKVQLQFRGKGMISRTYWPAEMNTVTIATYNLLRKKLGQDIGQVQTACEI